MLPAINPSWGLTMMIWTMRFAGLGFSLIGALFGSVDFTTPVAAQVNVAIESVTAANTQTAPGHAQALQSALLTSLALAIEKASKNGCDIKAIDISDEFLRGRQTELELQRKGYSQKNGLADGKIVVSDVINGVVGADGDGGLDYVVNVTNLKNNESIEVTGNAKVSHLVEAADKIAGELVEKLCKKRPYRIDISGMGTNVSGGSCKPKPIVTCDITKPFSGDFCGGTLTHTPNGDKSGAFTLRAAGGGGSFEQSGTYKLSGPEERLTGTYTTQRSCATAGGRTICMAPPRTASVAWTRVSDCGQ